MKVVALVSGGKDSCFNMMHCVAQGHEIVALANLRPQLKDELDSYMYQTVGHQAVELYAEALGLPLFRRTIQGSALNQGREYSAVIKGDEVEDLYQLLKDVQDQVPFEGVSVGAILSDYQRVRVEHVCQRLGVTSLAFLWRRDQRQLLDEMIGAGVKAVLIKVAALGLTPGKHLGRTLAEMRDHLIKMDDQFGLNPCGEGGEYETFALDCPLFQKSIVVDAHETVVHSDDAFAPVAYLNFTALHLEDKPQNAGKTQQQRMQGVSVRTSDEILRELFPEEDLAAEILADENESGSDASQQTVAPGRSEQASNIAPLTPCIRDCPGGLVYISSVVGDISGYITAAQQTRAVLEALRVQLAGVGLEYSDLAAVHLMVSNMADFASINAVYSTFFGVNPPIRLCVETVLPPGAGYLQLDAVALRDVTANAINRDVMHVQSLSHWAPANIGPYSQAVKLHSHRVYVAGQIALDPASGQLLSTSGQYDDVTAQARLSLRHVTRVLDAVIGGDGERRGGPALVVCYVTQRRYIAVAKREWERTMSAHNSEEKIVNEPAVSALHEYVVVPRLPRDALVEWQVVALVAMETAAAFCTREDGDFRSHARGRVYNCEERTSVTLHCDLDYKNTTPSRLSEEATEQCLCLAYTAVQAALERLSAGSCSTHPSAGSCSTRPSAGSCNTQPRAGACSDINAECGIDRTRSQSKLTGESQTWTKQTPVDSDIEARHELESSPCCATPAVTGVECAGVERLVCQLGTLRVFYLPHVTSAAALQHAHASAWRAAFPRLSSQPPPAAFIPVLGFDRQTQILSIVHV